MFYYIIFYYMILHCIALHYITLQYIIVSIRAQNPEARRCAEMEQAGVECGKRGSSVLAESVYASALAGLVEQYGQSPYTKILDFRGFDSNIILILRVEFPGPQGVSRKV